MSLSEQQIRFIVRDELRKILDYGLMATAEVNSTRVGAVPTQQARTTGVGSPGVSQPESNTHDKSKDSPFLMSLDELEKEPWRASAWVRKDDKDRVARPGEDAFLPRMAASQHLLQMINAAPNHKLELFNPPYESITFSGADGGLIARKGPKKARI